MKLAKGRRGITLYKCQGEHAEIWTFGIFSGCINRLITLVNKKVVLAFRCAAGIGYPRQICLNCGPKDARR